MADKGGSVLPVVLLGGAAYLGYKLFLAPAATAAAASGTPTAGGPATPAPTATVPTFNTPDAIYQRLVQNLTASVPGFAKSPGSFTQNPYQWKFYLDQVTQTPAGLDFSQLFPSQVNNDGSLTASPNMTLGQFWSPMAPWLAKNVPGMSGFRGMAGIIAAAGRRR